MLKIENKINYSYNEMYDILYIRVAEMCDSYGHEYEEGIVLNYSCTTKEFLGADIWDFKYRMGRNEHIDLPINVNLKEIYNNL